MRRVGFALLAVQLVGLLIFSTFQYSRYSLTLDFAYPSGAWWAIAHGQLNPWSSLLRAFYWRNNAEFLMWPLALLSHVYSQPVVLLWVQDLCVVAAEAVAFLWVLEFLRGHRPQLSEQAEVAFASGAIVALVLNPWAYETIAFDFHFETVAALFLILAGWALWSGRISRLWLWVPLTLLSSALSGMYLVGLGVSGVVAGRRTRRTGLIICAVGVGWAALFNWLGAVGIDERVVNQSYSYLTGAHGGHASILAILSGAVGHPGAVAHVLRTRWATGIEFLAVVGLVGVLSPWGLGVTLAVFVPPAVAWGGLYFRLPAAFQVWPALPFVLVGSVMVIARLHTAGPTWRRAKGAVVGLWASSLLVFAVVVLPDLQKTWIAVDASAASQLNRAERLIPTSAEVVVSGGIVGRFGEHQYVYNIPFNNHAPGTSALTIPVSARQVFFVITPRQGISEVAVPESTSAVSYVRNELKGRLLISRSGVYVLEWSPPVGRHQVTLP